MITAIIAEKPSVAKDIANVLGVRERHDGYLSGNDYLVTWRSAILYSCYAGRLRLHGLPPGKPAHHPAGI